MRGGLLPALVGELLPAPLAHGTLRLPLSEAAHGYDIFQKKEDGAFKVVFKP